MNRYELVLRQEGGRGYWTRLEDGRQSASQTPINYTFQRDTTGEFSKRVVRGEWVDSDYVHRLSATIGGSRYEGDPWTMRFELGTSDRYATRISSQGEFYQRYVGFCSMDRTPQEPLSAEETEAFIQ